MRGLIDRITNRDRVEELEQLSEKQRLDLMEREEVINSFNEELQKTSEELEKTLNSLEESNEVIQEKNRDLDELGEMADSLVATVRVLKMRIDTVMPAGQPGIKPDE